MIVVYNVLIVDDEVFVRMGLKMTIDWEREGYHLIGEASSGEQALRMMEAERVDLLLTDIKMPNMDGIELIKCVKKKFPYVRCAVLSNHDDYQYVKEAMKWGAEDYMLKATIEPQELLTMLGEIAKKAKGVQRLQRDDESQRKKLIAWVHELLETKGRGFESLSGRIREVIPPKGNVVIITVEKTKRGTGYSHIRCMIEGIVNPQKENCCFSIDEGQFFLIFDGEDYFVQKLVYQLHTTLVEYMNLTCSIAYGISYESYVQLQNILIHKERYSYLGFYDEKQRGRYEYEEIKFINNLKEVSMLSISRQISNQLRGGNLKQARQLRDNFFNDLKKDCIHPQLVKECAITLNHHLCQENWEIHLSTVDKINSSIYLNSIIEHLENVIIGLEKLEREPTLHPVICQALAYVDKHYTTKISLEDLAKAVSLNKSYLSRLFKQEMGMNIQDYLIQIRMEKARELLVKTNEKIGYIARAVGYTDIYYFNRAFRKNHGMTPTEYKKNQYNLEYRKERY